jgi:peptidoglycan/LPS O-acetylase OafA/YrhL
LKSIAEYAAGRDNNFNLLRFVAAGIVLLYHSYPIALGPGAKEPLHAILGFSSGEIAVNVFFVISGFLIARSFLQRRDLASFVRARIVRIFPGYFVAVLACVFGFGLAWTTLSASEFVTHGGTWRYLAKNSALLWIWLEHELPGVFEGLPFGRAVNGSLWTLPWEMWMYISVMVAGLTGLLSRRLLVTLGTLGVFILWALDVHYGIVELIPLRHSLRFLSTFYLGTLVYLYREQIPLGWKGLVASILVAGILYPTPLFHAAFHLVLPYWVFWCAYVPRGVIRRFNEIGDYSYGLYLYAFPVQQSVVALLPNITPWALSAIALPATLGCAFVSWHLIEKRALRWKSKTRVLDGRAPMSTSRA